MIPLHSHETLKHRCAFIPFADEAVEPQRLTNLLKFTWVVRGTLRVSLTESTSVIPIISLDCLFSSHLNKYGAEYSYYMHIK